MKAVPGGSFDIRFIQILMIAAVAFAPVFFAGCTTTQKGYSGPYRQAGEVAYLQPDREKAFTHVAILSVDGIKWSYLDSRFEILPGPHQVDVRITLDYPYLDEPLSFRQDISFETEAAQTYTIHGKIEPIFRTGDIWVTSDQTPGESMAKWHSSF